jgi:UDPglucose 6-dehydrogenase/GDP-mannose 6-dehydrogenase
MRISIVGTGYVGLVTGACLAANQHSVVCVDIDPQKVATINAGETPIHEAGLGTLVLENVGTRLRASTDLAQAVAETDVTFIAVGTPASDGRIDLRYVERVADEIGAALRVKSNYHAVVVKSTVIPGTTAGTVRHHLETASGKKAGVDFGLGMNPEFLTEGTAVQDFLHPDRLVLGAIDGRTHALLQEVYSAFESSVPRILTNTSTAEMIKYASNAVLATMISFSNELARLCSAVDGVDAMDVMRGVHEASYFTARREGQPVRAGISSFLEPGCGFGGSCLPKDVTALIGQGQELDLPMPLLHSVLEINQTQVQEMLRLVERHFVNLLDVPVTVLGIAFKPDTDDIRESPAFPLIRELRARGARITAYDPIARPEGNAALAGVCLAPNLPEAVSGAQVVLLVTRWSEFSALADLVRQRETPPLVVDGRRMLDPADFARYEGIGR